MLIFILLDNTVEAQLKLYIINKSIDACTSPRRKEMASNNVYSDNDNVNYQVTVLHFTF